MAEEHQRHVQRLRRHRAQAGVDQLGLPPRRQPLADRVRQIERDEQVAELLRGRRLGLAESCSGGMLAARITDVPGASDYFAGSAVTYSYEAKEEILGVPKAMLEEFGAVSPQVAEAMARGALEHFGADVAVSITGIAGPDGGSEKKPVGYVCFDARLADGTEIAVDRVIPGNRADIRERSALVAMHLLRRLLGGDGA
jgi:nicotinamide-nucleotide amidase